MVFFCGFFVRLNYQRTDEFLIKHIESQIQFQRVEGKYLFIYPITDNINYYYDIDSNRFINKDLRVLQLEQGKKKKELEQYISEELFVSAVGGVTLGYTFKDVLTDAAWKIGPGLLNRRRLKKLFVSIMGAVTGYTLGHWAAEKLFVPSNDSDLIIEKLKNLDYWVEIEKRVYSDIADHVEENLSNIQHFKDMPKELNLENYNLKVIHVINRTNFETEGVTSHDIKLSNDFYRYSDQFLKHKTKKYEKKTHSKNGLLLYFGWASVGLAVFFWMYTFLIERVN